MQVARNRREEREGLARPTRRLAASSANCSSRIFLSASVKPDSCPSDSPCKGAVGKRAEEEEQEGEMEKRGT